MAAPICRRALIYRGRHPLELPPVYPCSQGTPIDFAVPFDCLRLGDSSHGTVFAVRCIAERHGQRYKSSGFFAVLTWFGNSRGFLPLFPNVVPARRIAPGVPVPVGMLALLRSWQILRRGTYPIRTVIRFSRYRCCYKNSLAKKCTLSRISKRSEKNAKQGGFPRLETERRRGTPCR